MGTHVDRLTREISRLQAEENVAAIRLLRTSPRTSHEAVAKGVLDLLEAQRVEDNEFF